MKRRGMTLVETLIACALFLTVTGVVLNMLISGFRSAASLDDKQQLLQRFILARRQLTARLLNANLRLADCKPDRLVYLKAVTADTAIGRINEVGIAEMTQWDNGSPLELVLEGTTLVERPFGGTGLTGPSHRVFWNLGEGAKLETDVSQLPLVELKFTTLQAGGQPWKRAFTVRVENYG